MPRFFNTAGPCQADIHYMLDPLRRLEGVRALIDRRAYFVVHAPRQVGKTTSLMALAAALTREGSYAALLVSCEVGRAFPDDPASAERAMLADWRGRALALLPAELRPPDWSAAASGDARIHTALREWALSCPRPLVLFVDEIDALSGASLLSVLGQLRSGHALRPGAFPASVALVGLRDVRDYKAGASGDALHTSSPFNVKEASLGLRDFTREEVAELYAQHTSDTGQRFEPDACELAFELTRGQPWLVNALAREATDVVVPDRSRPVTVSDLGVARDRVIARQDTHLDSLAERLREPRVRSVMEPLLAGGTLGDVPEDDARFVADLGLVRVTEDGFEIANPIYREIVPRVLAANVKRSLPEIRPTWMREDGRLDADALLTAFLSFWRQHGEALQGAAPYHEIAPHLVLMAFLHRVVNSHGRVEREYALGRGRMDLLVELGPPATRDRLAIEVKVWRARAKDPVPDGLAQLDAYLSRLGLATGWLVMFDQRGDRPIDERTSAAQVTTPAGRTVTLVRA